MRVAQLMQCIMMTDARENPSASLTTSSATAGILRFQRGTRSTIGQFTRGLLLLYFPVKNYQNRCLPFLRYNEVHVVTSTSYHRFSPMIWHIGYQVPLEAGKP
jgi:hypothetical protein